MRDSGCWTTAVLFVIVLAIAGFVDSINRVTVDAAVQRFAELAEVDSSQIEVIRHSNNNVFFGEPRDVTFELTIDGKPTSGRCTSGLFSPMVCRIYTGGE